MKDLNGRPWASVSETKEGSVVECDGDFTCLKEGDRRTVKRDEDGLYIDCAAGQHYLDGQFDGAHKFYIGLYLVSNA